MKSEEPPPPFIGVWLCPLPAAGENEPEDTSTLFFMRFFPNGVCTHHLLMLINGLVFRYHFEGCWSTVEENHLLLTVRELEIQVRMDHSGEDTVMCVKNFRGDGDLFYHRSTEEEITRRFQNLAENAGHFLEVATQDLQEHAPGDWP